MIDDDDIAAVVEVLKSDWLTTGPKVDEFERAFAGVVGAKEAVAVSSGTAALHAAMFALDIQPGDEVIVPPMTFSATANCVVFQGGIPVFADVDPANLLMDPEKVDEKITLARRGGKRTKAIMAVDYAGHPCDYDSLRALADKYGLALVDDACHALGGAYKGRPVGSLAGLNAFSFHPVKHITTGEGGMITTDNETWASRMRLFRTHGITRDPSRFATEQVESGKAYKPWYYEMVDLGYNYRLTDFQCALGLSQLRKLKKWVARRQAIAHRYDAAYEHLDSVRALSVSPDVAHAYHLYAVRVDFKRLRTTRGEFVAKLHARGIGTQVHYIPVHLQPFYRRRFGTGPGLCPVAEAAYEELVSLPMYPAMTDGDVGRVIEAVVEVAG